MEDKIVVYTQSGSALERLTVLRVERNRLDDSLNIAVAPPVAKLDPQEVSDLKARLEFMASHLTQANAQVEEWKKRFDALLFSKGPSA